MDKILSMIPIIVAIIALHLIVSKENFKYRAVGYYVGIFAQLLFLCVFTANSYYLMTGFCILNLIAWIRGAINHTQGKLN